MSSAAAKSLRHWFGFSTRVGRASYAATGFGLTALKYAVDAVFVRWQLERDLSPLDYLNPSFHERLGSVPSSRSWTIVVVAAWTLPFLWIGMSMTLRRALDAGLTPWIALLWLVPFLNYALMLALCALPSRDPSRTHDARLQRAPLGPNAGAWTRLFVSIGAGLLVFLACFGLAVLGDGYGRMLFLASPFASGVAAGYVHDRRARTSLGETVTMLLALCVAATGALLLFALEGVVCIVMASFLVGPIVLLGGLFGRELARWRRAGLADLALLVALVPATGAAERLQERPEPKEVLTAIEIAAPREIVWRHVVAFAELPAPDTWLFRTGIAYPLRATIEGSGVGALRRCEFTTGAFVEPITAWDEPRRLAFDVLEQPPCMHEWSFYANLHPPHLDTGLHSRRGEFRLVELPGGRTRLEGRTWYELELRPRWYWAPWSEAILHAIHARVLRHIRALSETSSSETTAAR